MLRADRRYGEIIAACGDFTDTSVLAPACKAKMDEMNSKVAARVAKAQAGGA